MKQLRIGILGAGFIGRQHGQRLCTLPGVHVTALCDTSTASATRLNNDLFSGSAQVFDNARNMLTTAALDAVYICLPPYAHAGEVELAAAQGLHVFLEKPIALTTARAQAMVTAIERAGVISQVGYHMRYGGAIHAVKRLLVSGRAGRPTLLQARFFCNALHTPWWRDIRRSGGQVFEQIIHMYDLACHLLGQPNTVAAFADNLCHKAVPGYSVEDTSAAIVRFEHGALASIVGSNCAVPTEWRGDFRLVCEKMTFDVADPNTGTVWHTLGQPSEYFFARGQRAKTEQLPGEVDCYREESRQFIAAIRGQRASLAPAREGLLGVRLVTAVLQSVRHNGRVVKLR